MNMSATEIVSQFYRSLEQKDFVTLRACLHDSFSMRGPFHTFNSVTPYIQAIQGLSTIVNRIEVLKMFADGNDVCVLYNLVTNSPAGTAFIAEWFHVTGGKIAAIQVVFDPRPFEFMFDGQKKQ
jgi:hypothetical protein